MCRLLRKLRTLGLRPQPHATAVEPWEHRALPAQALRPHPRGEEAEGGVSSAALISRAEPLNFLASLVCYLCSEVPLSPHIWHLCLLPPDRTSREWAPPPPNVLGASPDPPPGSTLRLFSANVVSQLLWGDCLCPPTFWCGILTPKVMGSVP